MKPRQPGADGACQVRGLRQWCQIRQVGGTRLTDEREAPKQSPDGEILFLLDGVDGPLMMQLSGSVEGAFIVSSRTVGRMGIVG